MGVSGVYSWKRAGAVAGAAQLAKNAVFVNAAALHKNAVFSDSVFANAVFVNAVPANAAFLCSRTQLCS